MACTGMRRPLQRLLQELPQTYEIPSFLAPTLSTSSRNFSTSTPRQSRIGGSQITVPPEVNLRFFNLTKTIIRSRNQDAPVSAVEVVGPLGQTTLQFPPYLSTTHDAEDRKVSMTVTNPEIAHQRAMWGTMRAHLQNSISGVTEGHICILRLVGVGYRATIEPLSSATTLNSFTQEYPDQQFVNLKLGYAHPIELPIPKGVKATIPQPTRILLEGCEKQVVTQFAAEIRQWRVPEPYKGKGIFVNDETIRLKAKKIK